MAAPERLGSLAPVGAPEGVRGPCKHGAGSLSRRSTAGEASPGVMAGPSSGFNTPRRRSPQPRAQPTIQDQGALLSDDGLQAVQRARVSGRGLGGGGVGPGASSQMEEKIVAMMSAMEARLLAAMKAEVAKLKQPPQARNSDNKMSLDQMRLP